VDPPQTPKKKEKKEQKVPKKKKRLFVLSIFLAGSEISREPMYL
jgi:hypothetical protein